MVNIVEDDLSDRIYTIRGQKVMLDYDLARFYGYTTSAFNQQVKNNIEKFEGEEFMFRLTKNDVTELLLSNFLTAKTGGRGGDRRYPYAFTEQGIYMLMTVLKGELAVRQTRALIMTFKKMKDYIIENQLVVESRQNLQIVSKVANNRENMLEIKNEMEKMDNKIKKISIEMNDTVKKSEISPILLDFSKIAETKEFLIMNGEPARAKETFMDIYGRAKKNIYIVDNYIDIRSLRLLKNVNSGVKIIFFTDNINLGLRLSDYEAFRVERPDLEIKFIKTNGAIHDRFIILDNEVVFSVGTSSKDAGGKITVIYKIESELFTKNVCGVIKEFLKNKELELK